MKRIADALKVGRDPVEVPDSRALNLLISSASKSSGRLLYGPDEACDYDWLEPGQSMRELGSWPGLWLKTAYSEAWVTVWSGVGLGFRTTSPKIGTSFKGGPPVELAADGTVSQLSTTVIGTHALTLAQDPRNHPSAVVWVSTHVDLVPAQRDENGKPLPGSGPPQGNPKQFPLLYGQYLPVPDFNSAVWAWAEPDQKNVGPIRVYFMKHEFGV